jgi:hypothetical protein
MEQQVFLSNEELSQIQSLNNEFTKAKITLGELEIQKVAVHQLIAELKSQFSKKEVELIEKYGKDSVINIQTGEVTQKTE